MYVLWYFVSVVLFVGGFGALKQHFRDYRTEQDDERKRGLALSALFMSLGIILACITTLVMVNNS